MYNVYGASEVGLASAIITNFDGMVICSGEESCELSRISNGKVVACLARLAWWETKIENVSMVVGLGYGALAYAKLSNVNINTIIALGSVTAYGTTIYNISDKFNLYCDNNTCLEIVNSASTTLYCYDINEISINMFDNTFLATNLSNLQLQQCSTTQQPTTFPTSSPTNTLTKAPTQSFTQEIVPFLTTTTIVFGIILFTISIVMIVV